MATKGKRPLSLGELSDRLWEERERKRALEEQMKDIERGIEALTLELLERMEAEKLDQVKGSNASVSIGTNVIAKVDDWEAFGAYIVKNKYLHLLQRRVSDPAYRELLERLPKGKSIPGVEPFVKKRLNIRTV